MTGEVIERRTVPWTARTLAALPLPPLAVAALVSAALVVVLVAVEIAGGQFGRFLRGEAPEWKLQEYRFSVVFSLLAGYLTAATALAVAGSRRAAAALRPVLGAGPDPVAEIGHYAPAALRRAGVIGALASLLVPFAVDLSLSAYAIHGFNTAAASHRILLPLLGWLLGGFVLVVFSDSRRLARLGRERAEVDLLDPTPLEPFVRYGLRSALLFLGMFAVLALLIPDWRARPGLPAVLATGLALAAGLAGAALVIPLRGVHDAIAARKRAEEEWCLARIRGWRGALAAGRPADGAPLDELTAYLALVQGVRTWPLDLSTLVRFALYLGIPVGSWLGGALVERLVDRLIG